MICWGHLDPPKLPQGASRGGGSEMARKCHKTGISGHRWLQKLKCDTGAPRTGDDKSEGKASALSKGKNEDSAGEGRPAIIAQGGRGFAEIGECLHNETEETARIRQEIGVPPPPSPPPIEPPQQLITIVRNRNNMPKKFSQLDGTSHQGVDNEDNEEPDGLEERETDNQEPEETNETDASVGESYDALWKLATEMCNSPISEMWGCVVCPVGPDRTMIDKGEEESSICNMELFEVEDWMPPLPM